MSLQEYFPIWNKLSPDEQQVLANAATTRSVDKGELLLNGSSNCIGLFIVCAGLIRVFITSKEGKEITIYRLFERDICLFSASCIINSVQFDISIEAEDSSKIIIVPSGIYKSLMKSSAVVANYTNELMATKFSEVMWLIEQIMWERFDKRLASFLISESALCSSNRLQITHDKIAAHMGTAREVVTRMLKYFQSENMVVLGRGSIELKDINLLQKLCE